MASTLVPAAIGSALTLLLQGLLRVVRRDAGGPPAGTRHWADGTLVQDARTVGRW
ncbi:hypothetical protein GXB85_03650 [Cellulomonas sp. APG4]|uniref:hypothetical protein n=1 Tax=Cellulomonas sp. APG4 TaxID=1538656 RepID=UPI001379BF41|nr:hypothetical protein [Cellulomonas sp. APG4]NCT90051.1 hypothetical protein [Cellulomonas sp. APG4]